MLQVVDGREQSWHAQAGHVCAMIMFSRPLHPPGRAYVVFPLKLLELSFLGLVLLGKTGNDLANLMEKFRASRWLNFQRLTPSQFVCNAGTTSLTVLSTRTPPIMRKHFLSGSPASASFSVDRTKLDGVCIGRYIEARGIPNVHMLFSLLFEFSDFRCEVLKVALEARVCLLHLFMVYR